MSSHFDNAFGIIIIAVALIIAARVFLWLLEVITGPSEVVYEYEVGVLFRNGVIKKILKPGQYRFITKACKLFKIDVRPTQISMPHSSRLKDNNIMGYEVIVNAQIIDPKNYIVQSCLTINDSIKSELKIELRDVFATLRSEDVMLQLSVLEKEIAAKMNNALENIGIKVSRINFTSISFADNEKKIANLSDYVL